MPKTGIRTIVEVTTNMSDTLKPNMGTHHTPNPLCLLYILELNILTTLCFSYSLWRLAAPIPPLLLVFKKASPAAQDRRSRGMVAIPTPKTGTRTIAEVTTNTSDTVSCRCVVAITHSC